MLTTLPPLYPTSLFDLAPPDAEALVLSLGTAAMGIACGAVTWLRTQDSIMLALFSGAVSATAYYAASSLSLPGKALRITGIVAVVFSAAGAIQRLASQLHFNP